MADNKGNLRKDCAYSDGLHFNAEGYKIMGKVLFNDVIKQLIISEWLD
jgi:lysophospholipase L1-like esterase